MKALIICLSLTTWSAWANKPLPQVFVEKAVNTKVKQTLLFPSLVKSRIESNIRADADLIVIRSKVTLGQKVNKGDVLLEMSNQDTSMNFNNRLIKAPVAGVVAALLVGTGEYVQHGQQLALINDPSQLYLKLEIPIAHYNEIKPGLLAEGSVQQMNKKSFKAKVSGVGAVLDPTTGTMSVELEFTSKATGLLPGTIANVELFLSEEDRLLIPEKALYYSGDKTFVPLLTEGKVKKVEVKTRTAKKGLVEVLEGVEIGNEVIVGSGEFLQDGEAVKIIKK